MANGKLPRITLMNFRRAARRARGAPGNDNGKWQTTSRYSDDFQLRRAPGARHTWQQQLQMASYLALHS
eukprot:12412350-Karenia_brevis.AAC.1